MATRAEVLLQRDLAFTTTFTPIDEYLRLIEEEARSYLPSIRYRPTHGPVVTWENDEAVYSGGWRHMSKESQS